MFITGRNFSLCCLLKKCKLNLIQPDLVNLMLHTHTRKTDGTTKYFFVTFIFWFSFLNQYFKVNPNMNRPPFMGMAARNAGVGYKAPVGKMTNNQDPKSKASRVFVGNLNTGEINDQQLYKIFAVYGMITDVSTINGFGFVQFDKIEDAQEAVRREQGRVVGDQPMG